MIRRIALTGGILLTILLTGCLEEDRVITLLPDGKHGKMTIERALGGQMAEMMMSFGGEEKGEAAKSFAATQMAQMEGISAWTDVSAEIGEDGKIRFKATAWFEDLSKVIQSGENSGSTFEVEQGEGTLTVRMKETTGDEEGGDESLFSQSDEEFAMAKQMTAGMLSGMLAGFRMSVKLELPGPVTAAEGFTQEGSTVTMVRNSDELIAMINKMFEVAEELRPKVKAGELSVKEAEAQMKSSLSESMSFSASCTLPTGTDDTVAAFQQELEQAKAEYESGEWKAAVEQAKEEAAAQGEMDFGDMGMGGDEGGEEPQNESDWNESAAIGALKTINVSQSLYREADKDGNGEFDYAPDLASLGKHDLIDSVLASGTKRGYTFKLARSSKAPEFMWMAVASPSEPGTSGTRHFAINHEGVVYESANPIALNDECTMPEGAQPVSR